jgi:carbon-monoxide dehydrogenase medium subunit
MRADRIETARIAVGSVERVARRWERLEACLVGSPMDAHLAAEHAASLSDEFHGRDDVAAPGWYRRQVLPTLVRRAIQAASA